jgi:hypothetical protein
MYSMMAMGENDHDYDIALDWLIDNGIIHLKTAK